MKRKANGKLDRNCLNWFWCTVYSVHDDGDTNINSSDRGCAMDMTASVFSIWSNSKNYNNEKENYTQLKSTAMFSVNLMVKLVNNVDAYHVIAIFSTAIVSNFFQLTAHSSQFTHSVIWNMNIFMFIFDSCFCFGDSCH